MSEYTKVDFKDLEINKYLHDEFDIQNVALSNLHPDFRKKYNDFKTSYGLITKNPETAQGKVDKWNNDLKELFLKLHDVKDEEVVQTTPEPPIPQKKDKEIEEENIFNELMDRTKKGSAVMTLADLKEINVHIKGSPALFSIKFQEFGFKFEFTKNSYSEYIVKKIKLF